MITDYYSIILRVRSEVLVLAQKRDHTPLTQVGGGSESLSLWLPSQIPFLLSRERTSNGVGGGAAALEQAGWPGGAGDGRLLRHRPRLLPGPDARRLPRRRRRPPRRPPPRALRRHQRLRGRRRAPRGGRGARRRRWGLGPGGGGAEGLGRLRPHRRLDQQRRHPRFH